jgi:hypothetical protein
MSAQLTHQEIQPNTTGPAASHPAAGHPTTGRPAARPAIGWRLRWAWYQIRLTVAEMNYASRRVAELQAPWTVDAQWHAK